jgi:hypothetical protein
VQTLDGFEVKVPSAHRNVRYAGGEVKLEGKGASVAFVVSYYGFIYAIFSLGASHMGLQRRPRGKASLAQPMGWSPRPNHEDHRALREAYLRLQSAQTAVI